MGIKSFLKKILSPGFRIIKKIFRPLTKRLRRWFIEIVREAILNDTIETIRIYHNEERYLSNSILERAHAIEQKVIPLSSAIQKESEISSFNCKNPISNASDLTSVPFGILINNNLLFTQHPILEYYYTSTTNLQRLAKILFQSYELSLTRFLKSMKKSGLVFLEVDPQDGYHTLSLAANMVDQQQLLIPWNPILDLNIQFHNFSRITYYIHNSVSRSEVISSAYNSSKIDVIILNNYQSFAEDLNCLKTFVQSKIPTLILEYSPDIYHSVEAYLQMINPSMNNVKTYRINRLGRLEEIDNLKTIDSQMHLVIGFHEEY